MHLSIDELIALPVGGKLAELLEGQLGNDFCAHRLIIPPRGGRIHWFVCMRPTNTGNISFTASYPRPVRASNLCSAQASKSLTAAVLFAKRASSPAVIIRNRSSPRKDESWRMNPAQTVLGPLSLVRCPGQGGLGTLGRCVSFNGPRTTDHGQIHIVVSSGHSSSWPSRSQFAPLRSWRKGKRPTRSWHRRT